MLKHTHVKQRDDHYPFQVKAIDATERDWAAGRKRVLIVLPTGAGKSRIGGALFANKIARGGRGVFLAHTKPLVQQFAKRSFEDYEIWATIEGGGKKAQDSPLVCGTVPSMRNRIAERKYTSKSFDIIGIDEAHRSVAEGHKSVCSYFDQADIFGLTATPRRGDQRDIMSFFDSKSIDIPLSQLINEGYLSPLTIKNIPLKIELHTGTERDFTEQEVAHAIEPYLESAAKQLIHYGKGRCCMVFLPLIETSKRFTEILRRMGAKATHVDGTMKDREIQAIINATEKGTNHILCNAMLLSEGVDIRPVSLILNLRLTRSWTLYTQIVGRGTRIFIASKHGVPGCLWGDKEDCILLDPLWLCDYHNLIQRPSCLIAVDDQHAEELDALLDAGGDLMEAEKKVQANREDNIRKRLEETAKRKEREISAMELFARCGMMQDVEYQPILREEMGVPTPGQAKALTRYGIDLDTVHSRGQAHKMLDAIGTRVRQGLASPELAKKAQILGMTDAWTRPFWDVNNYIKEMAKYTGLPT